MAKKSTSTENSFISIPDDAHYPLNALTIPACYKDDLDNVMIPEGLIHDRIKQLAHQIHAKLGDQQLAILCILKGSYRFFTALVDQLTNVRLNGKSPMTVDFIRVKSYEDTHSTGKIDIIGMSSLQELTNQNVLVVDDIVDSGLTLSHLLKVVYDAKPKSVTTVVLLDKRVPKRAADVKADFLAFEIPDKFVVGYGLDYNQKFRDLNHVCVMSASGIEKYKNGSD